MAAISGVLTSDQITSLIDQASASFQAPANALQAQEQPIQAQISALGKVQGSLSSLQSALAGLANLQTLSQRSVTTSPSGTVEATVTNDAATGTYTLSGVHLAQAESLISTGFASSSASLGSGSIVIQTGSGPAVTVNIASGQDNLSSIANAIDQANAGVQATVVYDGTSYHLALRSDSTGTADAFTVSGSGGLAGFSYHPGASGLTEVQAPKNSNFSLNGIAITSGSNTINGVIPGLSLTLAASGSATVIVSQSVDALDTAANSVVSALNNVFSTINQYSTYNATSGAGPLFGNVGLEIVRSDLLDAITSPAGPGATQNTPYNSLSAIGFTITSGGTVTLNDATFQSAAQSDYGAVAALLGSAAVADNPNVSVQGTGSAQPGTYAIDVTTNTGGSVSGSINGQVASGTGGILLVTGTGPAQGLALQIVPGATGDLGEVTVSQGLYGSLSSIANSALASGTGSITGEVDRLNNTITGMNKQIAALQRQAQQETQALTQQYSVAQATLSQLATVSSFLTTYFNQPSGGSGA